MYIWIIFKYSIFINHDLLLFLGFVVHKGLFNPCALASYHLFATRFPIDCQLICLDWRKSRELISENCELFADRLATLMWFEMPIFSLFLREDLIISSFVIFYSHCFLLLSLTFSALRMWPEVALLVTGCSNGITKSSVALWITGVFMWMLMVLYIEYIFIMTLKFDVGGILSGYTRVYLRRAVIFLFMIALRV